MGIEGTYLNIIKAIYDKPKGFPDIALLVKNLPAIQKTLVLFLGWEDSLEKG